MLGAGLVVVSPVAAHAADEMDVTILPGLAASEHFVDGAEGPGSAFDNDVTTKYHTDHDHQTWLQFSLSRRATVTRYTVTSANDEPTRDPRAWVLEGSTDDRTWTALERGRTRASPPGSSSGRSPSATPARTTATGCGSSPPRARRKSSCPSGGCSAAFRTLVVSSLLDPTPATARAVSATTSN